MRHSAAEDTMPNRTQDYASNARSSILTTPAARSVIATLLLTSCAAVDAARAANLASGNASRRAKSETTEKVHTGLAALALPYKKPLIPELMITAAAAIAISRRMRFELRQRPTIVMAG